MRKRIISVLLVLSMICTCFAGCKKVEATTMRLIRYEGKVNLEENGKRKSIKENIRLNSGNELETSYFSSATIGLDDVKIVSMDQKSLAEFNQSGRKLALNLLRGSIFFEVQEPLEDDETFEITTSTMMIGIRGTSGYVEVEEDGSERLIITDGVVHVIHTNPITGEMKEYDVKAGEEIRAFKNNDDYRAYYAERERNKDDGDYPDGDEDDIYGNETDDSDIDDSDEDSIDADSDESDNDESIDDEADENSDVYDWGDGSLARVEKIVPDAFPAFARNYILSDDELKDKISDDMGAEELDEVLWDEKNGYGLSANSYGSYADMENLITALEQLEMVFRIASFTLSGDTKGLEQYLASKHVPGAQYITDWGMRMLDTMKATGR